MGLAADLARARHISLEDAASALGKVLAGNMKGMQAFGLSAKDAGGNTLTTAQAVAELNARFGGAAQANADTYAGKLQAMNAEWHNMVEQVGNLLLPVLADMAGKVAGVVGWFDNHRIVVAALAAAIGGPLVFAMNTYIARQAVAFVGSTITAIKNVGGAIISMLVPATEAATAAMTGAAIAEGFLTAGLSVAAGIIGAVAIKAAVHSAATNDVATAAGAATDAVGGLAGGETDLGTRTDATTRSLQAQADMFKKLDGDTSAQQDQIFKLISDQAALDSANQKLTTSTGANSEATKQAAQHAKDLKKANEDLKKADDDVTTALANQKKAQEDLNKLLAPQKPQTIKDAADAHEAANDRLTRANINVTEKTQDLTVAVAQYGAGSKEAKLAQLDLNDALREVNSAQEDVETTMQTLSDTQRQTVGTTEQINDATKTLSGASTDVTTALGKQQEAHTNLNLVLANNGALAAVRADTENLATNTLAWQQATKTLDTDWGNFQDTLASNPGLRDQLVNQVTLLKNNLPKGADVKPLNDILTMLNLPLPPKSLMAAFLDPPAANSALSLLFAPPSVTNPSLTGGGLLGVLGSAGPAAPTAGPAPAYALPAFGAPGRAAGGPVLPGGTYLVGEDGPEYLRMGSNSGSVIPGGGVNVQININGYNGDKRELALAVRDELINVGRNLVGVGLG
jgi:hypothetical protein